MPPDPVAAERKKAIHVLVVDDEPALADIAQIYLERNNFCTDTACSADDALHKLCQYPYDAIVSDYQMPGKDGIEFLKEVRSQNPVIPFILFTGRGREEVVIQALNEGADFYIQKGGNAQAQFAELSHKIRRAVERRDAAAAIEERNDVLGAILAASPFGIALVKNRTIQWVNESLAQMLRYRTDELIGMPVQKTYENENDYLHAGDQISSELSEHGQSRIRARLRKKNGSLIDCEVQMASINTKNPLYSRMVTITDITKRLAITREMEHLSRMPHLELNPVIEVNDKGQITYFNDMAIDVLIRHGTGEGLEAFLPGDLANILSRIQNADTQSMYRTIRIGPVSMNLHITISGAYRVARISVFDTNDKKRTLGEVSGRNS